MNESAMERNLGSRLLEQVDVVSTTGLPPAAEGRQGWVERTLLAGLAEQYREEGLELEWDSTFLSWVHEQQRAHPSRVLLTRLVERRLGDAVIPYLPAPGEHQHLVIEASGGEPSVAE